MKHLVLFWLVCSSLAIPMRIADAAPKGKRSAAEDDGGVRSMRTLWEGIDSDDGWVFLLDLAKSEDEWVSLAFHRTTPLMSDGSRTFFLTSISASKGTFIARGTELVSGKAGSAHIDIRGAYDADRPAVFPARVSLIVGNDILRQWEVRFFAKEAGYFDAVTRAIGTVRLQLEATRTSVDRRKLGKPQVTIPVDGFNLNTVKKP